MDMKNRIRNENVSGSRPVISRFYFHLRAGGFHPSSTIHINSPPNPNHLRLHLSLQNNRFQKKKKSIQKNRTPRLQIQPAAASPMRSRPPVRTSDSEHNPAGRRAGRGLQSRPATASTTPPAAEQVAASSPDRRPVVPLHLQSTPTGGQVSTERGADGRPVVAFHWLVHSGEWFGFGIACILAKFAEACW
jgi:hypothetical protein